MSKRREWLVDILVGGIVGGMVGAILAVNFIITVGIGYDVTIPEVFEESVLVGVITVLVLAAGPVIGVWVARWQRRRVPRHPQPR